VAASFIGRGNQTARRKPQTCRMSLEINIEAKCYFVNKRNLNQQIYYLYANK